MNDRILVLKRPVDVGGIKPGDVVVFNRPSSLGPTAPKDLVKRVIGHGGDVIQARAGTLTVNGTTLNEPYVSSPTSDFGPLRVPPGQLFVLGDNRADSSDSRVFGPIPETSVIGGAKLRFWPLNRLGYL